MTPQFHDVLDRVPVSEIRPGDTVILDGVHRTVDRKALGRDLLLGPTLWGDSHRAGRDLITRITYAAEIRRRWQATRLNT